jgi:hypothetical protein
MADGKQTMGSMSKIKPMTESEIQALVNAEITESIAYDTTISGDRMTALEYFDGEMNDYPAEAGRSSVTTSDVADTIGWIMPGLMRVFLSTDRVVIYEPKLPGDQAALAAKQATDYINHVFLSDCNGYDVLWDAFHDALLLRTGVIKASWDKSTKYDIKTYHGLTPDEQTIVAGDDEATVVSRSEDSSSLKIRMPKKKGELRIEAVAPENYFINRSAKSIPSATFHMHKAIRSRSDLIEMGYDSTKVKSLPAFAGNSTTTEDAERFEDATPRSNTSNDRSRDEIEVFECYVKADLDGDDIAEWNCVIMAGGGESARQILDWYDVRRHPFTVLTPERVPHRWQGRSIADQTIDVQRVKTALVRQTLDNLYLANFPQREVVDGNVLNPDEVVNPKLGGVIRVRQAGSVNTLAVPFVAQHSFEALGYFDNVIEKRTGVSRSTMQLDPEALQNQSATAANIAHQSSYSKIELIARNFADQLRDLFENCLEIVSENTKEPVTFKGKDDFEEVNPALWPTEMEVTIDVGLGTGSRDRDMAMLSMIAAKQEQLISQFGVSNPVAGVNEYVTTLHKMVEAAGGKSPELFFRKPTPEEIAQYQQMQSSKSDPKAEAEMAKVRVAESKAQGELAIKQQKANSDTQLAAQKHQDEMQLRREEMAGEAELKAIQIATRSGSSNMTNIPRQ